MFDGIAERYDFLNHLLSAGIDRSWRRRAIRSLALRGGERVLDVCAGTADLAMAACRTSPGAARVVGVDFAARMLQIGQEKLRRAGLDRSIALVRGDATKLPVADASVDAVTVAFGIRNVEDARAACEEMYRVLKPGGRLAVLEFAMPRTPVLRSVYVWYFRYVLPCIGNVIARHDAAYSYLPASVDTFTPPGEFVSRLQQEGFIDAAAIPLTGGIVFLYTARRGVEGG